jgi:hypothetical protein
VDRISLIDQKAEVHLTGVYAASLTNNAASRLFSKKRPLPGAIFAPKPQ